MEELKETTFCLERHVLEIPACDGVYMGVYISQRLSKQTKIRKECVLTAC